MSKYSVLAIGLTVSVFTFLRMYTAEGIVIVPGYEHAVALCQGGEDEEMVTQKDEYHMWQEDGVMYTVNYGHLKDKEIEELQWWAQHECAQYTK